MFEIRFYETEDNRKPAVDFINAMDVKMKIKTLQEIELLKEFGNQLREPYSKALRDGLFELRVQQGNNIVRVFYFFFVGKQIILTNGFIKKTQKTPKNEIEKALGYKADFERRETYGRL